MEDTSLSFLWTVLIISTPKSISKIGELFLSNKLIYDSFKGIKVNKKYVRINLSLHMHMYKSWNMTWLNHDLHNQTRISVFIPIYFFLQGLEKEWSDLLALVTHHTVMSEMLPCTLRLPHKSKNPAYKDSEDGKKEDDPDYQRLSDFTSMMAALKNWPPCFILSFGLCVIRTMHCCLFILFVYEFDCCYWSLECYIVFCIFVLGKVQSEYLPPHHHTHTHTHTYFWIVMILL